jgi:DNA-binding NarL/FixJ family response regulator
MYKILMVDDHAMVRRGLRAILEDQLDDVSVCEAGCAQEGLERLREQPVDAVILDIGLPDRNGLELLKRIHKQWPRLPTLILSMYSEDQYGLRTIRAGAAGYLTKGSAPENLVSAVKRIRRGGRYISPELAERLADHLTGGDDEREPHQALSDREYQVFTMLARGMAVSEVATHLTLSVKTISTHRARILEKTNMKNNAELTHYAVVKGLVD